MVPIQVKKVTLGSGRPVIAASITGRSVATILEMAQQMCQPAVQLVEWRIDFFTDAANPECLVKMARQIQTVIAPRPLLITLRTAQEGGQQAVSPAEYAAIYQAVIAGRCADLVDLQINFDQTVVAQLLAAAHARDIPVILSYHDFKKTPASSRLLALLEKMTAAGGDVAKFAVMPHSAADVLRILEVSNEYRETGRLPLIAIGMGPLGKFTRVGGGLFGSCLTFGTVGQPSAPGQIAVDQLDRVLTVLQQPVRGC